MDVQCERCKTEYEFDDALISGRGTTVRCTTCGHQFKVRRPESGAPTEVHQDRWLVTTTTGRQLVFLSLRELQRAILSKQVSREDTLLRGRGQARPLGSIAELDPFFEGKTTTSSRPPEDGSNAEKTPIADDHGRATPLWGGEAPPPATAGNVAPRTPVVVPPPAKRGAPVNTIPGVGHSSAPPPPMGEPRKRMDTLRPRGEGPATPPPPAPLAPPHGAAAPRNMRKPELSSPLPPRVLPPPRVPARSDSDLHDMPEPIGKPRVGGWMVAAVLFVGAAALGVFVLRPYLTKKDAGAGAMTADARVAQFLAEGEKQLAQGNLDAAKENFDKAHALSEKEPQVLLAVARLSAIRADLNWFKLRLLPSDAKDEARATELVLKEQSVRAKQAATDALAAAPDDAGAIRAQIDSLRIAGDRDGARKLVSKVIGVATQPETAYVLAALDLAEPEPIWGTVIERLRNAASAEAVPQRARLALVYALARSGERESARVELEKISLSSHPHPLIGFLRGYVDHATAKTVADAGAPSRDAGPAALDVNKLPHGEVGAANDNRSLVAQAMAALAKGESAKARGLYEAQLAKNPNDSEALSGLGDVARAQGDQGGAIAFYRRALAVNPSYLPALVGLADAQWNSGHRAEAVRLYKEIVDRFPERTYPPYVRQRAEGGAPSPTQAPPSQSPPQQPLQPQQATPQQGTSSSSNSPTPELPTSSTRPESPSQNSPNPNPPSPPPVLPPAND